MASQPPDRETITLTEKVVMQTPVGGVDSGLLLVTTENPFGQQATFYVWQPQQPYAKPD